MDFANTVQTTTLKPMRYAHFSDTDNEYTHCYCPDCGFSGTDEMYDSCPDCGSEDIEIDCGDIFIDDDFDDED